jgi:hypothetical protein
MQANMSVNDFQSLWCQYFVLPRNWTEEKIASGESPLVHFGKWLNHDWVKQDKMNEVLDDLRRQAGSDKNYPSLFAVKDAYAKANGGAGYSAGKAAEGCSCCDHTGLLYAPVAFKWEGTKQHAFIVKQEQAHYHQSRGWNIDVFVYPCKNCGLGRAAQHKAFRDVSQKILDLAFDARVSPVQFYKFMNNGYAA